MEKKRNVYMGKKKKQSNRKFEEINKRERDSKVEERNKERD